MRVAECLPRESVSIASSLTGPGPRHLGALGKSHYPFISREGRDLGVAFQAPPGSQASSRGLRGLEGPDGCLGTGLSAAGE